MRLDTNELKYILNELESIPVMKARVTKVSDLCLRFEGKIRGVPCDILLKKGSYGQWTLYLQIEGSQNRIEVKTLASKSSMRL